MAENRERTSSRIISIPLSWLHSRWNEMYYGFSDGKPPRDRMETLLSQETVGLVGIKELCGLMGKTHRSRFQLRMAEKMNEGAHQLVLPRFPQKDMQALRDYVDKTAREEGLQ